VTVGELLALAFHDVPGVLALPIAWAARGASLGLAYTGLQRPALFSWNVKLGHYPAASFVVQASRLRILWFRRAAGRAAPQTMHSSQGPAKIDWRTLRHELVRRFFSDVS
jgi:hypothetical protein